MGEQLVPLSEAPIVSGLCDSWPASECWTPDGLLQGFAHHKLKARPEALLSNKADGL